MSVAAVDINSPEDLASPSTPAAEELEPVGSFVDSQAVKGQAISGVKALAMRTGFTLLLRIGSSTMMARLLLPRDYGIFGIAAWVTALGAFLGDAGLAGALIRQHKKPTDDEALTVFAVQQAITAAVVALIVIFGKPLAAVASLPVEAVLLLQIMAFNLFNNSLRCIPLMALERELRFGAIAKCELAQSLVNTAVTLMLAWAGWGAWSLLIGAMAGGVAMIVATWIASPWRPRGRFRAAIVAKLARFGVAYQLNSMVPVFLTGWMPVLVGRFAGMTAVGFANWATNIASVPMMLSAVLNRVAFPAYSRLSNDADALNRYLITSVRRLTAMMCVIVPLSILLCPPLIPIVFRQRWVPAIPLVQWFAVDTMLATLLGIVSASQNATGHPGDRLITAVVGGLGRWIIGYFAVQRFALTAVGPTLVSMTVVELFGSAWLLTRRRPEVGGLLWELFSPLAAVGAVLVVAMAAGANLGGKIGSGGIWTATAISLAVFVVLMLGREALTGGRTVWRELQAIVRVMRPVRV